MKRHVLVKSLATLLTGIVLFAGISILSARPAAEHDKERMQRKASRAESILRGLALGDLKMVGAQAAALEKLTAEAEYELQGEQFADYGRAFLKTVRDLKKDALDGNLAGSYYQFTRMTGLCFSCHEQLRGGGAGPDNN